MTATERRTAMTLTARTRRVRVVDRHDRPCRLCGQGIHGSLFHLRAICDDCIDRTLRVAGERVRRLLDRGAS